jgi:molecular chaperone GrpE
MASKERVEPFINAPTDEVEDTGVGPAQVGDALAADEAEQDIDVAALQAELEEARAKAEEHWNKLLRVQAEMENLRKRNARELEQARRFAVERFATELLAVKDSLEMGVDAAGGETEVAKLREGTELTLRMLSKVMEKFNIEEINPERQPFDPERHQAMTLQENSELPPNTVVTVMQKGYAIGERLLRPAMVIVSKAPD